MSFKSVTPTVSHGDSFSPGQVARMWERSSFFVQRMIDEGKLMQDERGLITNEALGNFYRDHGTLLH